MCHFVDVQACEVLPVSCLPLTVSAFSLQVLLFFVNNTLPFLKIGMNEEECQYDMEVSAPSIKKRRIL